MTIKFANNKITDIINENSGGGLNISRVLLFLALCTALTFLLISFSSGSVAAAPGEQEENAPPAPRLHRTKNSGRVLWELNIATATGIARIPEDTPQGKLLGRRGALTDARRNLLILRHKLLKDQGFIGNSANRNSVSGNIAGVVVHSEKINNNLYILQVDIPLDKLMEGEVEIE